VILDARRVREGDDDTEDNKIGSARKRSRDQLVQSNQQFMKQETDNNLLGLHMRWD